MAVTSTLNSVRVNLALNNGTQADKVKTVNVSLGNLSTEHYNDQKAMNIVNLLEPCLAKEVHAVEKITKSSLASDE